MIIADGESKVSNRALALQQLIWGKGLNFFSVDCHGAAVVEEHSLEVILFHFVI